MDRFSGWAMGRRVLVKAMSATLVLCCTFGCSSAHLAGRPERSLDRKALIKAMEQGANARTLNTIVDEYYKDGTTDNQKTKVRNELIDRSIILIDQHYSLFIDEFSSSKKTLDSVADISSMATATAAVLMTPEVTKSILSAVSGGITASKASIDKNFLYDQTIVVLIKQMEAQRRAAVVRLIVGTSRSLEAYPLSAALADIEQYYFAGSFDGALAGIQQEAALTKDAAERDLLKITKDVEASLKKQRERGPQIAEIASDTANRAALLDSVERALQALDPSEQPLAIGQIMAAFDNHLARNPDDAALKAIDDDPNYWKGTANAMIYLRQHADAAAVGQAIAGLESKLGLELPTPP